MTQALNATQWKAFLINLAIIDWLFYNAFNGTDLSVTWKIYKTVYHHYSVNRLHDQTGSKKRESDLNMNHKDYVKNLVMHQMIFIRIKLKLVIVFC